jgi:hypothetical protein
MHAVLLVGVGLSVGQLHQPPANTGISVFAMVRESQVNTNAAYWGARCKDIAAQAAWLVLDMGDVRDYFKPKGEVRRQMAKALTPPPSCLTHIGVAL